MIVDAAVKIIKEFESLRLKSYLCPSGIWTIGWGATYDLDDTPIQQGMTINEEYANLLLKKDIEEAEKRLRRNLKLGAINDNMYGALTSITFNCGTLLQKNSDGQWVSSPLLQAINTERWHTAAERIYSVGPDSQATGFKVTAKGKVMPGLLRRRKEERLLFETPSEHLIMLKVLSGRAN